MNAITLFLSISGILLLFSVRVAPCKLKLNRVFQFGGNKQTKTKHQHRQLFTVSLILKLAFNYCTEHKCITVSICMLNVFDKEFEIKQSLNVHSKLKYLYYGFCLVKVLNCDKFNVKNVSILEERNTKLFSNLTFRQHRFNCHHQHRLRNHDSRESLWLYF